MLKIVVQAGDGTETDVTEGVKALYDLVIGSMDWGSGFLTYEDALPVLRVAEACGFGELERVRKYVDDAHHSIEQREFVKARFAAGYPPPEVPHDHVFSSAGRCLWPWCPATP
jgi:hypothetical protein